MSESTARSPESRVGGDDQRHPRGDRVNEAEPRSLRWIFSIDKACDKFPVSPERPADSETLSEAALTALVTRDAMVGIAKVKLPKNLRLQPQPQFRALVISA